jgi:uncharacterized HAD superfamily protein
MSATRSNTILVDIDSTLYDADPVYLKYFDRLFGVKVSPSQCDDYDFWKGRISLEQFLQVITHLHSDEEIAGARPYPGALATLRAWHAAGLRIHIVSDRKPTTVSATLRWLAAQRVPSDAIVLEPRFDKLAYARAHGISFIFDDKPALLRAAADAGLGAASIAHAYHDQALRADPRVVIAANWTELRARVEPRLFAPSAARTKVRPR